MPESAPDANLQLHLADTELPFSLRRLMVAGRTPVEVGPVTLPSPRGVPSLQYEIHSAGEAEYTFGPEFSPEQMTPIIDRLHEFITQNGLEWKSRGVLVTVFTNSIAAGRAQNPLARGWHLDPNNGGLADYLFFMSNTLPTQFSSEQKREGVAYSPAAAAIVDTRPNTIYFSSVYGFHRGQKAPEATERIFMLFGYVAGNTHKGRTASPAWSYNPETKVVTRLAPAEHAVA